MVSVRRRRRTGERGASLVEAALVTPVFFLLIFSLIEFGLLFRDSLTTTNAAHQGARSISVAGQAPEADYGVLQAVERGLGAINPKDLDFVVVFRADGPDDVVPAACLNASQPLLSPSQTSPACNRYLPADLDRALDDAAGNDAGNFRCGTNAVDRFWCPTDRETNIASGVEYAGLHVQTRHRFVTGLYGDGKVLSTTRIVRLEPESR